VRQLRLGDSRGKRGAQWRRDVEIGCYGEAGHEGVGEVVGFQIGAIGVEAFDVEQVTMKEMEFRRWVGCSLGESYSTINTDIW
jgi:hypothetical protein